jgi:hypothetical protein
MRRSERDRGDDGFKIRSAGGRFLMGGEQQPRIELAVWSAVAGMTGIRRILVVRARPGDRPLTTPSCPPKWVPSLGFVPLGLVTAHDPSRGRAPGAARVAGQATEFPASGMMTPGCETKLAEDRAAGLDAVERGPNQSDGRAPGLLPARARPKSALVATRATSFVGRRGGLPTPEKAL